MWTRFLNPKYVFNTLIIKARARRLTSSRGPYPYEYFKDRLPISKTPKYALQYVEAYKSLDYFDHTQAQKRHGNKPSITQELILGLTLYNDFLKGSPISKERFTNLAHSLEKRATWLDDEMTFYISEEYPRFDLSGRYGSGIVQGKAASYFLRCFSLTGDEQYKTWARACLKACLRPTREGGVCISLKDDLHWIEEYPSPRPSMVLNGFLFYLIAMAEYLSQFKDATLQKVYEQSLRSVLTWLPAFRLKKGMLYSMYRWNLCNVHYTAIMKYQFDHLHELTAIPIFEEYARWTSQLTDWEVFDSITS